MSATADEEVKEETSHDHPETGKCKPENIEVEQNNVTGKTDAEVMPPPLVPAGKVDVPKHENSDVVEDSINLTLEDEENFDEVSNAVYL